MTGPADDAEQLVKTTVDGLFSYEDSHEMLRRLATDPKFPDPYDVLIDLRQAPCRLSYVDVFHLVRDMEAYRSAFRNKVAVVVADPAFDTATFMELCAENRGLQVRAFTEIADAEAWLAETHPAEKPE